MSDLLSEKANQSSFANLVGCSQPAISKHAKKIGLQDGETHGAWLKKYVAHLRSEAAGRSLGDDNLATSLKLRKLQAEVTSLDLDNETKLGSLVIAEDATQLLESIGKKFVSEIQTARMQIIAAINSKYDIELDENVISEPMQLAARSCESHAAKLAESVRATGP